MLSPEVEWQSAYVVMGLWLGQVWFRARKSRTDILFECYIPVWGRVYNCYVHVNGEWKTFIEEQFDPPHSEVTVGSRFGPTSTRHIVAVCLGAVTSPLWRGMN
ncbi:hypothetical protein RB195_010327 [Necator americanus]|uniref:Calpain catalytic domain-containing protein n=1 Tax=Necator americanus TaxID=51031 RepID=A0ABR1CXE7_NECAM